MMKLRIFNFLIVCLLSFAPGLLTANDLPLRKSEFKKEYNKSFNVNMGDKLLISNRHGKVEIKTWDQAKVTIDVTITVNAKNESNAQEVFDRIKIDLNQAGGMVTGKTEIQDKSSWSKWVWGDSGSEFKIDYLVKMPAQHHLTLSNKYGHSYVDSFSGDGDMTIKYGDLFAGNVGGDLQLYLGYGNAQLGSVKEAKMEVKYSKIKLESSNDANIDIKYSKLTLDDAGEIKLTSGYDDLNFGKITSLSAYTKYSDLEIAETKRCNVEAKYTDVSIERLLDRGEFELGYGGINIDYVGPNFSSINILAKYAGIKLHPDTNASYQFSADVTYASVRYPENAQIQRDIDQGNRHEVSGYLKSQSGGKIQVKSSYGSVKIY